MNDFINLMRATAPPPDSQKGPAAGKAAGSEDKPMNTVAYDNPVLDDVRVQGHGATPDDWFHFSFDLDLGPDLLPVVSNLQAEISPDSSISEIGKTPSEYNRRRQVRGFPDWTNIRATDNLISRWSSEPDHGICIQTRDVRACDVDVTDPDLAARVRAFIDSHLGIKLPCRRRSNSSKFLLPFRLEGEYGKHVINLGQGNQVEFLMNGQQFIAVGTHPSGVRYEWEGGLPGEIPSLSAGQFDDLVQALTDEFKGVLTVEGISNRHVGEHIDMPDPAGDYLRDQGLVLGTQRNGALLVKCPNHDEHTTGKLGDGSTVYFPCGSNGKSDYGFECRHGHCGHMTVRDYLDSVGYVEDCSAEFEVIEPDTPEEAAAIEAERVIQQARMGWHPMTSKVLGEISRAVGMHNLDKLQGYVKLDDLVVRAVYSSAFWHPEKSKFYLMPQGGDGLLISAPNKLALFVKEAFGAICNWKGLESVAAGAAAKRGLTDKAVEVFIKSIAALPVATIADAMLVERQASTMQMQLDMFSENGGMTVSDGIAKVTYPWRRLAEAGYDPAVNSADQMLESFYEKYRIDRGDEKRLSQLMHRHALDFAQWVAEVLGHREGLNSVAGIWRLGEQTIEFGSVPNLGDERKYQGRAKDLLVIDEAANFLEQQVRFLMGWVRTTEGNQKTQTLFCFNPPTSAEGRWVVDFFAPWLDSKHPNPAAPGELRWFAVVDGKEIEVADNTPFQHGEETITPQSRTFIPAKVTDNPYLADTGYMAQLQSLPEPLRSQMLHGDFQAGMEDDPWQVIPTAWVEAAMGRWKAMLPKPPMRSVGVDVARGGRDSTVIARRHEGMWFDEMLTYPGVQTPDGPSVAGLVISAVRNRAVIHLDVIGVGASPYDFLKQANQHILGINVAEAPTGTDKSGRLRFTNLRSQLWWQLREALDPTANNGIALPPDRRILADLTAPRWDMRGDKIFVESRDDIVKRIGRSPDFASALILALIDTPKMEDFTGASEMARQRREYDPMAERTRRTYNPFGALVRYWRSTVIALRAMPTTAMFMCAAGRQASE